MWNAIKGTIHSALAVPGGAAGMRPPNRIQFFHFLISFRQKAPTSEVSVPPPPTARRLPQRGNPGSANAQVVDTRILISKKTTFAVHTSHSSHIVGDSACGTFILSFCPLFIIYLVRIIIVEN